MNLYDINKEQEILLNNLERFTDENWEVSDDFFEIQEELENKLTDKVDNIWKLIKSLEAHQIALITESEKLEEKAKKINKKIESIKKYAENIMNKFWLEKMDWILFSFNFTKSKQTEILDELRLPLELKHRTATIKDLSISDIEALHQIWFEFDLQEKVNKTEAKKWYESLPLEQQEKYKEVILIKEVKTLDRKSVV
jgi:hypothetical protein